MSDLVSEFESRIEAVSGSEQQEAGPASHRSNGAFSAANGANGTPGNDRSGISLASSAGKADEPREGWPPAPAPARRDSEISVTLQDIMDSPDARNYAFRAAVEDADEEATHTAVVALRQANEVRGRRYSRSPRHSTGLMCG